MLAADLAFNTAMRGEFDLVPCQDLENCLLALANQVLDEDENLPIFIEDDTSPIAKVMMMLDVAFCCWMNDEPAVTLPPDVALNHAARMRLNDKHRRNTVALARIFIIKYGKLMSPELALLGSQ